MTITTTRARTASPVRDVPGAAHLPAEWRAALRILRVGFPADDDVWARVHPGRRLDLYDLIADTARPMGDRVLLACALGHVEPSTVVPWGEVAALSDGRMGLVLEALAIARGSLPID